MVHIGPLNGVFSWFVFIVFITMAVYICIYTMYSVHICKYYIRNYLFIKHMSFCALCYTHSPEIC